VSPVLAHQGTPDELAATLLVFAGVWAGWVAWSRLRNRSFTRMPHAVAVALVPVSVGLVVLSAIVPGLLRPKAPVLVAGPRPRSSATLSIEKPVPGQVVTGNVLPVVLRLTGGTIVTASSTTLRPDQGHIHISLDGRLISMTYGTLQTLDLSGVKPSVHQIEAEYVASDHGPFNPRVTATVSFRVAGEGGAG
jgi:hypothetical protein